MVALDFTKNPYAQSRTGKREIKLADDKFPHEPIEAAGYEVKWFGQKTNNGVALLLSSGMREIVKPALAQA